MASYNYYQQNGPNIQHLTFVFSPYLLWVARIVLLLIPFIQFFPPHDYSQEGCHYHSDEEYDQDTEWCQYCDKQLWTGAVWDYLDTGR